MRVYTKTIYVSDDGREFDNDLDCRVHEKQYEIVNWLSTDLEQCLNERSCDKIVRSLLKKFDITPREDL